MFEVIFPTSYLQVELVEGGQELCDGTDALVGHVDAVGDGEADEAWVEAGPEALHQSEVSMRSRDSSPPITSHLLRDLVTPVDLQ